MSATRTSAGGPSGPLAVITGQLLKIIGLAILNAFALLMIYAFLQNDAVPFAIVIALVTLGANVIAFVPKLYPLRWMTPGLAFMILLVVYPIIFTVYTAFTNYGDGHLFSKSEAIELHAQRTYVPEDAPRYRWTAFVSEADDTKLALWLTRSTDDGGTEVIFAQPDVAFEVIETDDTDAPETYNGFRQLERREMVQNLDTLQSQEYGLEPDIVLVTSAREASRSLQRYVYDAELDGIEDRETGQFYKANDTDGIFVAAGPEGQSELSPGYRVNVGFRNFLRFVESPALRGPLVSVFIWTVIFAFLSVVSTFTVGLFMALIMNDPGVVGRKVIRSLLIIPYAIPGVISILVWRGMMNPNIGVFAQSLGITAPWFSDPNWSKFGILLINLWLGYPYMMLVNSGALQAIPSDIYEAAAVDGASPWQRFWNITLPLLLVAVGPLLIASFTYNFNNFVIIDAFNKGGPPIAGTLTPAGHTDILISYTFRLAFGTGRGADYGLASAITIIIFAIVAIVTLLNFRLTGQWEEVSENV